MRLCSAASAYVLRNWTAARYTRWSEGNDNARTQEPPVSVPCWLTSVVHDNTHSAMGVNGSGRGNDPPPGSSSTIRGFPWEYDAGPPTDSCTPALPPLRTAADGELRSCGVDH